MRVGMAAAVAGLLAVTLCGCNHDPLLYTPDVDAGPRDLSPPPPDFASNACRTHQILSVPLTDIELLNEATARAGSAVGVRVSYSLRQGCDVAGDLNVRVMPGNATDFVVVTMRTWRGDKDCGPAVTATRIFWLGDGQGLSNQNLLISDGAPSGTKMIHATLKPLPPANCNAGLPLGQPCNASCECAQGTCAPYGGNFDCIATCAEDADCPDRTWCSMAPREEGLCLSCPIFPACSSCAADSDCRSFGQRCEPTWHRCVPGPYVAGGSCTCDADCGEGRLCDQAHSCFVPCTTAADCGAPATLCDGGRCR